MWRKMRKRIAAVLAGLMVFGSLQLVPIEVMAEESGTENKTYTMDQLTQTETWYVTPTDIGGGGKKLTFADNWMSIFYAIPNDVLGKVEKITFNVTSDNAGSFAYKTYTEEAYANKANGQTDLDYGNAVITPAASTKSGIKYIAITSNHGEKENIGIPIDMEIASVTFTVKTGSVSDNSTSDNDNSNQTTAKVSTATADKIYSLGSLTQKKASNVVSDHNEASGSMKLDFSQLYAQVDYEIPSDIDFSKVKKVSISLKSGSAAKLALKTYTQADYGVKDQTQVEYGKGYIVPSPETDLANVKYISIMSTQEGENSVLVGSITFTVEGSVTYPATLLEQQNVNDVTVTEDNGAEKLDFAREYSAIDYKVPNGTENKVDFSKVKKVIINLKEGDVGNLALKTFTDSDYGVKDETQVEYGKGYIVPSPETDLANVKYITVMSIAKSAYSVNLDSITFVYAEDSSVGVDPSVEEEIGGATSGGDKVFTADKLSLIWETAKSEKVGNKLKITFAAKYDETKLKLPEAIDLSNCLAVKFTVENQTVPITLKLWKGETEAQTEYGLSGQTEYVLTPTSTETIDAVGIMITEENPENAEVTLVSVTFTMKGDSTTKLEDNIIKNPNFAEEDLSMWNSAQGNSVITAEVSDTAIFGDVKTYGKISRDSSTSSTQDCFSQDITAAIEKGAEYQFEFYAKLSDEYANAPEDQRKVEFCPYITADGATTYLGTYSSELTGNSSQALTPGEWTKYSGTFTVAYTGTLEKLAIRIIEQGTEYGQGECVKGDYYVTGVSMRKIVKEKPEIEQDIPDFKKTITADLGADTIAGALLSTSTLSDETYMELLTKHFNAVSFENEMKPDAMFGYASTCTATDTVTLNGENITVPKLDHSRADKLLNWVLDWNKEHTDAPIKVRGHVLVWHSQTPEWFFHEDYDASKPYVTPAVMNKRLEWYIKTVLEYYTGANSKYKDLFYGWDVVNEAISDATNTYRSKSDDSSWAAVYGDQSNEYIINAFKFANKYAPASLELYYNDYNECVPAKRDGIVKLLQAVKSAEGARIDAMGMQAHHMTDNNPTVSQIEDAARAFAAVVGKIQLTELDLKATSAYNGTDATKDAEYSKQAYRYKAIYDVLKKVEADGVNVTGITIWGVIDKYSWLHTSNSVGGAASGSQKQCPLLFDDNYKAKPAFWAFVNPNMLEPATQKITIMEEVGLGYENAETYIFGNNSTNVTFLPIWDGKTVKVQVTVEDASVDATDSITLYVDAAKAMADGITPQKVTVNRSGAKAVTGGYQAELSAEVVDAAVAKKIGFDIRVTDGNTVLSFNDLKNTQDTSSKYYAEAVMKPYAMVANGTAVVDGVKEAVWTEEGYEIPLTLNLGSKVSAKATALWDESYLYVFAEVKDADLNNANAESHQQDSLEVFIDENNHKTETYEADDKQYRISYTNERSFNGSNCVEENVTSVANKTADGYVIEAAYKWTEITPEVGMEIGLEFQINDADSTGKRVGTLSWYDESGNGWSSTAVYGKVLLTGIEEVEPAPGGNSGSEPGSSAPSATPAPTPAPTPEPSATPAPQATKTPVPSETEAPEEEPVAPSMPEVVEDVVSNLATLLGGNSTFAERLAAAVEIITTVKDLAKEGQLLEFTKEAIEYTEELICEALNKKLNVEHKDEDVPQISKVTGAILSVAADKEAKLTVESVKEDKAPKMPEGYENGYAMDIKLWEDDKPIQPSVPVTLRMKLPKGIDGKKSVKVLHYADGSEEAEVLDATVYGEEFEFTTTGFSTFIVVNVATGEVVPEVDEGATEEVETGVSNAAPSEDETIEDASSITPIIIVVAVIVVIALAIGAFIAIRSKKDDIVE